MTLTLRDKLLLGVAFVLLVASLVRPIHVVENGSRFDCGTSASSPSNYRQYPRLYGDAAGKGCQRELDRAFYIEFGIVVLAMASVLAIHRVRREPPFDRPRRGSA